MIPAHPLPQATLNAVSPLLQRHVVLALDLLHQSKQLHWNLRGPGFIAVHEFIDEVASAAANFADLAAERLGALGFPSDGTAGRVARDSSLPGAPQGLIRIETAIQHLTTVLTHFSGETYEAIKLAAEQDDPTTSDLFTQVSLETDQLLWKTRSHLSV